MSQAPSGLFYVAGFFGLWDAREGTQPTKAGSVSTFYSYNSFLACQDGTGSPMIIRHFSHTKHADNTCAFVFGKAHFPANPTAPIVVVAAYLVPMPGAPDRPEYDDHLPDDHTAIIFATGHLTSTVAQAPGAAYRQFNLLAPSYITSSVLSNLLCLFDNTARWANPPALPVGSCAVVGSARSIAEGNLLSVSVADLAGNLTHRDAASLNNTSPSDSPGRKFGAFARARLAPAPSSTPPSITASAAPAAESSTAANVTPPPAATYAAPPTAASSTPTKAKSAKQSKGSAVTATNTSGRKTRAGKGKGKATASADDPALMDDLEPLTDLPDDEEDDDDQESPRKRRRDD